LCIWCEAYKFLIPVIHISCRLEYCPWHKPRTPICMAKWTRNSWASLEADCFDHYNLPEYHRGSTEYQGRFNPRSIRTWVKICVLITVGLFRFSQDTFNNVRVLRTKYCFWWKLFVQAQYGVMSGETERYLDLMNFIAKYRDSQKICCTENGDQSLSTWIRHGSCRLLPPPKVRLPKLV
jgi:hypothetical protein